MKILVDWKIETAEQGKRQECIRISVGENESPDASDECAIYISREDAAELSEWLTDILRKQWL
jgi:hypothetical protein